MVGTGGVKQSKGCASLGDVLLSKKRGLLVLQKPTAFGVVSGDAKKDLKESSLSDSGDVKKASKESFLATGVLILHVLSSERKIPLSLDSSSCRIGLPPIKSAVEMPSDVFVVGEVKIF